MQVAEVAGAFAVLIVLARLTPWALRRTGEAAAEARRILRREPRRCTAAGETDLDAALLGPYVTPPGHHDFLADRWSVIADVAVVVGLEQSVRRVQSGGCDDVA